LTYSGAAGPVIEERKPRVMVLVVTPGALAVFPEGELEAAPDFFAELPQPAASAIVTATADSLLIRRIVTVPPREIRPVQEEWHPCLTQSRWSSH
jgi:hypothetical protein